MLGPLPGDEENGNVFEALSSSLCCVLVANEQSESKGPRERDVSGVRLFAAGTGL